MNEAETRAEHIDPALRAAGWGVVDGSRVMRDEVHSHFGDRQRAFLDFVLAHYVQEGVEELEQEKLTKLLRLKFHDSIPDRWSIWAATSARYAICSLVFSAICIRA